MIYRSIHIVPYEKEKINTNRTFDRHIKIPDSDVDFESRGGGRFRNIGVVFLFFGPGFSGEIGKNAVKIWKNNSKSSLFEIFFITSLC